MFLKQTAYKPRSGSISSTGSKEGAPLSSSPPSSKDTTAAASTGPVSAGVAGRRRSSASEGLFSGLQGHKRQGSDDHAAKKASFMEQKPGGTGIIGGMWSNFTKGTDGK